MTIFSQQLLRISIKNDNNFYNSHKFEKKCELDYNFFRDKKIHLEEENSIIEKK